MRGCSPTWWSQRDSLRLSRSSFCMVNTSPVFFLFPGCPNLVGPIWALTLGNRGCFLGRPSARCWWMPTGQGQRWSPRSTLSGPAKNGKTIELIGISKQTQFIFLIFLCIHLSIYPSIICTDLRNPVPNGNSASTDFPQVLAPKFPAGSAARTCVNSPASEMTGEEMWDISVDFWQWQWIWLPWWPDGTKGT